MQEEGEIMVYGVGVEINIDKELIVTSDSIGYLGEFSY